MAKTYKIVVKVGPTTAMVGITNRIAAKINLNPLSQVAKLRSNSNFNFNHLRYILSFDIVFYV